MPRKKTIGFNFFKPVIETHNGDTITFDLSDIFENIRNEYFDAKRRIDAGLGPIEYKINYSYNNEPARLSSVQVDVERQYYHLVFDKLDYQVPSRTTLHGESTALELADNEYIGIDVNILYDAEHHILMIQRNRNSLGPSGIETFLSTIIDSYTENINGTFHLAMVSDNTARTRALNQSAYRKIHMKVTGQRVTGLMERLGINNNRDVETIEISFNSRTTRDGKIDDDFARQILREYIEDVGNDVQKLQIRAREDEEGVVEPIDLVDHKLQAFTDFEFIEDRYINPESVFVRMIEIFDDGGYKLQVLRMR